VSDIKKPKLALWFRYGSAVHADITFALPEIIRLFSEHFNVYYISMTCTESPKPPESIRRYAKVIQLPFKISRKSERSKWIMSLCWIMLLPWLAIGCRIVGIRRLYVDETIPLLLPICRLFFGNYVSVSVVDFFIEQYSSKRFFPRRIGRLIENLDIRAWQKTPILITRAKSAANYLSTLGISPQQLFYAYDAVDFSLYRKLDYNECRQKRGWNAEYIIMVFHGILNPAKGLDVVLDALPRVIAEFENFRFCIIGSGSELRNLQERTVKLGLERYVEFTGHESSESIVGALSGGDIGLISRRNDAGSSLVVTTVLGHCFACEIAALAARNAGITELVVENETGLLFEPGSSKEISGQILRLCRDKALRKRLADAGKKTAERNLSARETAIRNTAPMIERWAKSPERTVVRD